MQELEEKKKKKKKKISRRQKKHWHGYKEKQPLNTTRQRLGKRHNMLTGRIPDDVCKSVGIKTVPDSSTFYNHKVFNYFLDTKQIEQTT